MTYPQAIQYLGGFINYERLLDWPYKESLQLDRFKIFLETIGNPQLSLRCIHVAGSKGKGSTCAFIAYILRQAGFKVGLYTSPHLSDFRERIRILAPSRLSLRGAIAVARRSRSKPAACDRWDSSLRSEQAAQSLKRDCFAPSGLAMTERMVCEFEGMISKRGLAALVARLKPAIDVYNKSSEYGPLSSFEVYTAAAFVHFKEKKVDFAVLETGLGGRFDATNTQDAMVVVITPISYEHTDRLGNTLAKIAGEKAGIIKKSCQLPVVSCQRIVISAPQDKEAREVIRNRCKAARAKLFEVGRDLLYKKIQGSKFKVQGIFGEYGNLKTRLLGEHQWVNAATAIGAIEALRNYDIKVRAGAIKKGLYDTLWPGRCEVVSRKPIIVLDGAQNAASSLVLKKAISQNFKYKRLILVLGISSDKDILGICRQICPKASEIILTQADNPRAASVNTIEEVIRRQAFGARCWIHKTKDVREALRLAKLKAAPEGLILVTGSLFVVGEARKLSLCLN
ncbi:MAG: bifunctional folylpolyglutamate synthase/dihydrofolate synthase [Candidatus Omnitrophica bacterium]|nr:bifunctional folylpolyglutamate synthase/dihydrofolate synthase [Candidatus Omnitrophota bacterium]